MAIQGRRRWKPPYPGTANRVRLPKGGVITPGWDTGIANRGKLSRIFQLSTDLRATSMRAGASAARLAGRGVAAGYRRLKGRGAFGGMGAFKGMGRGWRKFIKNRRGRR